MFKTIQKSTFALSVLMIMLYSLLLSPTESKAQSIPADVTTVCNYLNKTATLFKEGTESSMEEAVETLLKLENFRNSTTLLNSTSRDKIRDALIRVLQTIGATSDPSLEKGLKEEIDDCSTLGEVIKPFYDSLKEGLEEPLNE